MDHVLAQHVPVDLESLATDGGRVAVTQHFLHEFIAGVGEPQLALADDDPALLQPGVVGDVVERLRRRPGQGDKRGHSMIPSVGGETNYRR